MPKAVVAQGKTGSRWWIGPAIIAILLVAAVAGVRAPKTTQLKPKPNPSSSPSLEPSPNTLRLHAAVVELDGRLARGYDVVGGTLRYRVGNRNIQQFGWWSQNLSWQVTVMSYRPKTRVWLTVELTIRPGLRIECSLTDATGEIAHSFSRPAGSNRQTRVACVYPPGTIIS